VAAKSKTWAQLLDDIKEIERKWGLLITIENDLDARGRRRALQSPEERAVRVRLQWRPPGPWQPSREIRADVRVGNTATENLRLIVVALEVVRLAEVRGVHKLLALLYRQMYPVEASQPLPAQTPPGGSRQIPPHYAILHLDPSAPLEVAEAAYRALARKTHPDAGGSTEQMQRLNAAIERIREEKREA
jgi:hypothetical protein